MRFYSSTAGDMELSVGISPSDVSVTVDTVVGLPGTTPFTLVIEPGASAEEILDVTNVSGLTLTVTRGVDGSSAQSHSAGSILRHMATARDFREPQEHIAASSGAHGVTGSLVGTTDTQALTHKNLTDATNTFPSSLATSASLTAHESDTSAHGVSGTIVGTTDSQTLTGKTMSGSSNTFSNIPQAAVTGLSTSLSSLTSTQGSHTTELADHESRVDAIEANLGSQTTFVASSSAKNGKRIHWLATTVDTDASAFATVTHGAGFVPTVVLPQLDRATGELYTDVAVDNITATTFRIRISGSDGTSGANKTDVPYMFFLGE
jgi:hypothetical protein